MPDDATIVAFRSDTAEAPTAKRAAPQKKPERSGGMPSAAETARSPRRWGRWALFALLPLAMIVGCYWYIAGGAVMSTDDAYVEADKVGISTDVSGIVKRIDVRNNQQVEAGEVLFRLDDLPFRLALQRADAQVGIVRNDLGALKASYGDMQAQIKHITEAAQAPNITFQVISYAKGAHPGMSGSFVHMSFGDPLDPELVYIDTLAGDLFLEAAADIRRYRTMFEHLQAIALSPRETSEELTKAPKP